MAVSVAWYIAMKTMASMNDGVKQGGVKIQYRLAGKEEGQGYTDAGKVVARVQKEEKQKWAKSMLGGTKMAMMTMKFAKGHEQCAQIEKHGAGCKGATQQRMQGYFTLTCERSMSSVFKLAQHERLWPWRSEQGRA